MVGLSTARGRFLVYQLCDNCVKYLLKHWIALKVRSDLVLQTSFAIHLRATRVGFALENIVIVAEINDLKSYFCATLSYCFSIYLAAR